MVAEAGSPDGPYRDDPELLATLRGAAEDQIDATDWWWTSSLPRPRSPHEFQYLPFIAEAWVADRARRYLGQRGSPASPVSVGTVPEERQTYLPQWLQHEIFHHFYNVWSGFGLEDQSHQWFDRGTWPADFVGTFEPTTTSRCSSDCRMRPSPPSWGLRNAVTEVSFEDLEIEDVLGDYERLPVQNPWHRGEIRLSGCRCRG